MTRAPRAASVGIRYPSDQGPRYSSFLGSWAPPSAPQTARPRPGAPLPHRVLDRLLSLEPGAAEGPAVGAARARVGWLIFYVLFAVGFSGLALAEPLLSGEVPGAGPDVVSTLWGMWWVSELIWGGHPTGETLLVNFPYGASGAVLSPISAIAFSLALPWSGVAWASAAAAASQLLPLALAVGWLGLRLGGSPAGAAGAVIALFAGRPLIYDLGEASVVAVAVAWVPLGLIALVVRANEGVLGAGLLALCMGFVAVENPYLAPILPICAVLRGASLLRSGRRAEAVTIGAGLLGGLLATAGIAAVFAATANPDYPMEKAQAEVVLGPWRLPVVEVPWARARLGELLWPGEVRWTESAHEARHATGGRYLGLSAVVLGALGAFSRPHAAAFWAALALGCAWLAMGSVHAGVIGPFLGLNLLMEEVARPLTQPRRFLPVAQVGLAICVMIGLDAVRTAFGRRGPFAVAVGLGLLAGDALLFGSGSLHVPGTRLADADCLQPQPGEEGAVLIWPWDAVEGDASAQQLLQMVHGRNGPHRGIASWATPAGNVRADLDRAGWRARGVDHLPATSWHELSRLGFGWVISPTEGYPRSAATLSARLGPPVRSCGGYELRPLPDR